jgi:hypothetical protein
LRSEPPFVTPFTENVAASSCQANSISGNVMADEALQRVKQLSFMMIQ